MTTYQIEELKASMCKWPSGDPKHDDFSFCGKKTDDPALSYCEEHTKMAFRENTKSKVNRKK